MPPCSTEVSHERQTAYNQEPVENGAQAVIRRSNAPAACHRRVCLPGWQLSGNSGWLRDGADEVNR
nr:MAG TPA: hypothetical protein [Caudoviricetes sp.]